MTTSKIVAIRPAVGGDPVVTTEDKGNVYHWVTRGQTYHVVFDDDVDTEARSIRVSVNETDRDFTVVSRNPLTVEWTVGRGVRNGYLRYYHTQRHTVFAHFKIH